ADTPYETKAALLPKSLREAVFALNDDPFFRGALGPEFVDYYVFIKNAEIERFQAERFEGNSASNLGEDFTRIRALKGLCPLPSERARSGKLASAAQLLAHCRQQRLALRNAGNQHFVLVSGRSTISDVPAAPWRCFIGKLRFAIVGQLHQLGGHASHAMKLNRATGWQCVDLDGSDIRIALR
ncbi:hypothetical protein chiPu_0031855, partial [Chiloscyllium punctatum]|nr:hypothetical protein [Chiloscyllium punctatum]